MLYSLTKSWWNIKVWNLPAKHNSSLYLYNSQPTYIRWFIMNELFHFVLICPNIFQRAIILQLSNYMNLRTATTDTTPPQFTVQKKISKFRDSCLVIMSRIRKKYFEISRYNVISGWHIKYCVNEKVMLKNSWSISQSYKEYKLRVT